MRWYYDRLWIFDHVGRANQDAIFEVFEYAFRRYGITHFVIDSLMKCGIRGDDLDGQDAFTDRFSNFVKRFNAHGLLVAHSKKASEDVVPRNDGVKGSGGITDQGDNVLIVWRNKLKERAMQKMLNGEPLTHTESDAINGADAILALDKQREGDGWYRLETDNETYTLGQLLQEVMYTGGLVEFVSRDIGHPLTPKLILRFKTKTVQPEAVVERAKAEASALCENVLGSV
jgi:DNA-directed RNA polymerase subunit L